MMIRAYKHLIGLKHPYGTNAFKVRESEMLEVKLNIKIINFDSYVNENKTKHKNWPYMPHNSYRILIVGGSGSWKTNLLLKLIEKQPDIDKI